MPLNVSKILHPFNDFKIVILNNLFKTTFNNVLGFHVLFDSWYVPTEKDLAWTCVVLFLIAFCYEGIKVFKTVITIWMRNSRVMKKRYW